MKKAKARDLRSLSLDEIRQKKSALYKELFDMRQKKITGQVEKPHLFKQNRRQLAQLATLEGEKQNG
ncbi:MAG: 50S ribosomal protein L29 [Candidatus Omnitrophica bacterium]|nr:50S ribosomal protein L29 [Candidatus Omnitrophota bacterium]